MCRGGPLRIRTIPLAVMSRNIILLLVSWNILLSILLGRVLFREPDPVTEAPSSPPIPRSTEPRDSTALKDARIAYFMMDSVQKGFELVKEQGDRFRNEGRRLETDLQNETAKAQKRYQELMTKDHTYSTKAEVQADEEELQRLVGRLQELQSRGEERLARMEAEMLMGISNEIMGFLTEYNEGAGFDYIFSVQNGGQIWVGNKDLDITGEVLDGLNQRHRTRKDAPAGK